MSNTLHTNYVKLTGRKLTILDEMTNFMECNGQCNQQGEEDDADQL
jgi:hypothetical protein